MYTVRMNSESKRRQRHSAPIETGDVDMHVLTFRFDSGFGSVELIKVGDSRRRLRRESQRYAAVIGIEKRGVVMNLQDEKVDFGGGAQEKSHAGWESKLLEFRRPGEENLRLASASRVIATAVPVSG